MEKEQLYIPAEDAYFSQPYIDVEEWRDTPVRHYYVHGGFKGTEERSYGYVSGGSVLVRVPMCLQSQVCTIRVSKCRVTERGICRISLRSARILTV